ncbi:tRNA preQ1(34) S-adenosylmethionine ribosyltransferase-isomerase QueA [Dolichospermum circinale]|uniref:tRNA preQ1(34) S-adenosylmethionine ribosyltransferase-isomerase QueA n=1 Tax=Dolichospermum circinale TaxID=109265 RepID=UPI0003FE51C2|nr:tRNA preQ1(34) S-adenosylmethionine ribosyltransferase-isomerase QueA [Dolichospermum circinale]MDB9474581.1 tRNA preQ1(34) S-adenosylmethionine ribosyltransferase-isomerase QueA [Dolichospermum circinale CS-537/11]MDB9478824.1 tRNA preQ1(34) S-adenosylmethionine ribosyltransferase-isomerase QueA [Dolichospermum circinale CS-537/03]MDB9489981.1 tRNA preQ1(34) S-adenosylmethionine ribosyltransferase-isomerase QueA [Dolichospermum circinale CS-534/05]
MSSLEVQDVNLDCSLSSYDYELPLRLIAQNPAVPRDSSRLLVVNSLKNPHSIPVSHHIFRDLPELLQPGDLLVMNNTKVIPARLYGCKSTGAEIEVLLLEERRHNCWLALVKPGKRFKIGSEIIFTAGGEENQQILRATVVESDPQTGGRLLQFDLPPEVPLVQVLGKFGEIPLPPYITASTAANEQYQTVYAQEEGAIAAPTAGLHFTPELLERLRVCGINQAFITLHVGVGTFRPVEVEDVTTHAMHEEWIEVSADTVEQIRATQAAGGRIIAVGTTVVRALEGAAQLGDLQPFMGKTNLFIYPGYKWRVVEGLITNFHLPRSSLLMLVSALIGREMLLDIYQKAIASEYRFYSFGDAMVILPADKKKSIKLD